MINDTQQTFWDNQTMTAGYCEAFLKNAYNNNWIGMLKKSMSMTGREDFKDILELGGGSQILSRYLCGRFKDARVVCTDLSEVRINNFQEYYKDKPCNLTLLGGVNGECLQFSDKEFDLIIGDAVVSQFADSKKGFLEINRCLKTEGHAIFIREPVVGFLSMLVYRLLQGFGKKDFFLKKRFEHKRVMSQWMYEFIFTGFKVKAIGGWSHDSVVDRFRAIFPSIFPCAMCFVLEKYIDFNNVDNIL